MPNRPAALAAALLAAAVVTVSPCIAAAPASPPVPTASGPGATSPTSPTAPAAATAAATTLAATTPVSPTVERFTQDDVQVTMTRGPEKRIDFEVVVPASLDQVWQAFTTPEGLVTWLTPAAKVELRLGGPWEADFPGGKTGGGTILSFLPHEMLAVAALAPERFPTVRRERTQAIFRFEPVDAGHTRVRLAQIGWQSGAEWDQAFAYLSKGNAQLLASLRERFTKGPIDWQALMAGSGSGH
jgi:uncharacterized protein YndB with AHSA1/START domain